MSYAGTHPGMGTTTISVKEEIADELYERKSRGESYSDVIQRLINQADTADSDREEKAEEQSHPSPATAENDIADGDLSTGPPNTSDEPQGLDALIDDVADSVLPGSGPKLEARREALHAVVEYLEEQQSATPQDFQTEVYPDHSAYYTDGEDPARSWWKNCIYKGLRELAERSNKIVKADQSGEWLFRS